MGIICSAGREAGPFEIEGMAAAPGAGIALAAEGDGDVTAMEVVAALGGADFLFGNGLEGDGAHGGILREEWRVSSAVREGGFWSGGLRPPGGEESVFPVLGRS
jgi:hypothetical protein